MRSRNVQKSGQDRTLSDHSSELFLLLGRMGMVMLPPFVI